MRKMEKPEMKIEKKNIEDILSLTPLQEGMLFHYLKNPESEHYFEQLSLEISGEIDMEIFERAWNFVIETNEMLRAVFRWEKLENPSQIVLKTHPCQIVFYDLSYKNCCQKKMALEEIKKKDRRETFDLHQVPFRVILCKLDEKKHEVIISNHHILYDGWSTGIILKEFFQAYAVLEQGEATPATSVKPPFHEFIRWNQSRDRDKQKKFWETYLQGFAAQTQLCIERRGIKPDHEGAAKEFHFVLGKGVKERLDDFLKERRVTLAAVFYYAWGLLLQKYCGSDDVVFGTTVSGRSAPIKGIEHMVGLFINTIPLHITTAPGEKIKDLVKRINDFLPIREKYESTSLVDIKGYSELQNNQELFDSIIVLENYPLDRRLMQRNSQIPSLVVESYSIIESTPYPLTVSITIGEAIEIRFIYDSLLFEDSALYRLASHFTAILTGILDNFEKDINCIALLTGEEKQQILVDFNNTGAEYARDKTLHGLFEEQVERTPAHIALIGANQSIKLSERIEETRESGGRHLEPIQPIRGNTHISYNELKEKSHRLGHLLKGKGVKPDTVVGITLERSTAMVLGIMGILTAGGAYLPIDPDYPQERINYMLKDSGSKLLVTTKNKEGEKVRRWEGEKNLEIIFLDSLSSTSLLTSDLPNFLTSQPPNSPLLSAAGHWQPATSLAYIIYTSGSTGRPKGVMIEHCAVINFIKGITDIIPFTGADRILSLTTMSFDIFGLETLLPLTKGAVVIVGSREEQLDSLAAAGCLQREQITIFQVTPSRLQLLILAREFSPILASLKYLLVGGEVFPAILLEKVRKITNGRIFNVYGPTETTIWSTIKEVTQTNSLDIGKPIANTRVYIVNREGSFQPLGVPGEIVIAGHGVARGYLNQPETAAEKFIAPQTCTDLQRASLIKSIANSKSIFAEKPLAAVGKIYKTGDLARWLPDGNIEFLGRVDYQVKIRGFRIELGEIENQLLKNKSIKEAVVTAREDKDSEKYLCAYIVPRTANSFGSSMEMSETLKSHLLQVIPDYMVPSFFVLLDKIPLTSNGKVDRRALPGSTWERDRKYTAPRNKTEQTLVEIWSQVLGIQQNTIGIDDNFFELGGHSLKAAHLLGHIHKKLDVEISLPRLFEAPTVNGLAHCIFVLQKTHLPPIEPAEEKEYYELAPFQKRFFVFWQFKPDDINYNVSEIMAMGGLLSREKFEGIFKQLIRRHESLRTSFQVRDGEPVQRVHAKVEFEMEYRDFEKPCRQQAIENKEEPMPDAYCLMPESVIKSFIRPFDLSRAPLLRLELLKIAAEKHYLMFDLHHIVSDGVSIGIFIKEFLVLYAGEELPPLKIQYKDFVAWRKKKSIKTPVRETGIQYQETLLNLPLDFPRQAVPDSQGKTIKFEIGELEHALKALSRQEDATLYMVLLAAFNVFLTQLTGQENIVVGSPMAGRQHPDLEGLIGLFINPLVMQNFPQGHKAFSDFLREVKANALDAYENQDYQYEKMAEHIISRKDDGRNPFYDVMLVLQNMEMPEIEIPGLKVTRDVGENQTSKFDLTLYYEEFHSVFKLEYSTALFKEETIRRFIRYFEKVLGQIVANPRQTIAEIEIITAEEKQRILYGFNDTAADYPKNKVIHRLFTDQVEKTPDYVALVGEKLQITNNKIQSYMTQCDTGHSNIIITYNELNVKSDRLAHLLIEQGVQPDAIVGIMIERSIEMIIGVLGILKAGGAYLPIAPAYPQERIDYLLKDSSAKMLVSDKNDVGTGHWLVPVVNPVLTINGKKWGQGIGAVQCNVPRGLPGTSAAYVIYTSGSTGKPKGVIVNHTSIVDTLSALERMYPFTRTDVYLLKTSYLFDVSLAELFGWFFGVEAGGRLAILGPGAEKDPQMILDTTEKMQVTHINFVPSMFNVLVDQLDTGNTAKLSSLKYIFLAGEALLPEVVNKFRRWNRVIKLENLYGPTEAAIYASRFRLGDWSGSGDIPIGKPLYNAKLYILSHSSGVQPVGVAGELVIGGLGLARGYLNQPELTAEKFVTSHLSLVISSSKFSPNEQCPMTNDRLYKTGDLARWQPDGNIEFLGRMDYQVKIRGFRIELGEIENQLLKNKSIKEAVVTSREDKDSEKYLCAYIVPRTANSFGSSLEMVETLKSHLLQVIPDYMVPSFFVLLDKIHLTSNGKVDRCALPEPTWERGRKYIAPRNKTEQTLAGIWTQLLGLQPGTVGIDDNFFHQGGHSLKATLLASRIHKELNVNIPLLEIFKTPTIRSLSSYIRGRDIDLYTSIEPVERKEYYPLSSAQKRLYVIGQMDMNSTVYNISAALSLEGNPDRNKLQDTFRKLIRRHESLRTSFEMIDAEPVQKIHDEVEFEIEYFDLGNRQKAIGISKKDIGEDRKLGKAEVKKRDVPFGQILDACGEDLATGDTGDTEKKPFEPKSQEPSAKSYIKSFIRPFDLAHAPLHRAGLLKMESHNYILMVDMHHVISDGVSMGIFIKEFTALFLEEPLPGLQLQYKDFARWQNTLIVSEKIKKQAEYWQGQLGGGIPVLDLPTDYPRPTVQSFEGHTVQFSLDNEVKLALKRLRIREGITLYMLLLAICYVWVAKISRQEDIIVGLTTAGRRNPDLENIIGIFINTLAMRTYPTSTKTFKTFLHEVKVKTLETFDNQDYPFEDLVLNVVQKRDLSRNPLFDVAFGLWTEDSSPDQTPEIPELRLREWKYEREIAKFDLFLYVEEKENNLEFKLEYCTKLFKPQTIEIFISYYKRIVFEILEDIDREINKVEIISQEEKNQILSLIEIKEADIEVDFEI